MPELRNIARFLASINIMFFNYIPSEHGIVPRCMSYKRLQYLTFKEVIIFSLTFAFLREAGERLDRQNRIVPPSFTSYPHPKGGTSCYGLLTHCLLCIVFHRDRPLSSEQFLRYLTSLIDQELTLSV